jgi:hypothetical protein
MVKLLVVVVSCLKNARLWPKIRRRGIKDLIILCGGSPENKMDGDILYLKSTDTYDGLPEKMMDAFDFIVHSEYFSSFTHILKADDHDTYFSLDTITRIQETYVKEFENDYFGQRVWKDLYNKKYHFGRVPTTSIWHNTEYGGDCVPYLSGGTTYILSRKALRYLSQNKNEHTKHIYEDLMVGLILNKYNIYPVVINYGIRYEWQWEESEKALQKVFNRSRSSKLA